MKLQDLERALRAEIEKNKRLEKTIAHSENRIRTLEKLMSSRRNQAQRMEAIGTLASGIAHDFNNILAVISGNSELAMLVLESNSPARQYIAAISNTSDRAKDLVQQILTFTRTAKEEQRPTLIYIVINEVLKLLRASLPTTIEFELDINRDMHYVMADVAQIYQVLIKLCTFSAQEMEKKGGRLTVKLSQLYFSPEMVSRYEGLESGPHLKLVIRDTGRGMAPDQLNRLFDGGTAPQNGCECTGLEMPQVKEIVEHHNGRIVAHSQLGKGTTFTIIIPVLETTPPQKETGDESLPTGNEHILFLDDESYLTDAGHFFLSRLGYQVSPFVDSLKAWENFKEHPNRYDLIITDLTMPKMNGRQLASRISSLRPDIPLILCSGYDNDLSEGPGQHLEMNPVLKKPYALSELAFMARRLLDDAT